MTGEVETEGGASFLHCSVNGVKSRPKLVILDDTVHLFSKVGPLPQPGWRRVFGSAPPDWLPAGSPHPPASALCAGGQRTGVRSSAQVPGRRERLRGPRRSRGPDDRNHREGGLDFYKEMESSQKVRGLHLTPS